MKNLLKIKWSKIEWEFDVFETKEKLRKKVLWK